MLPDEYKYIEVHSFDSKGVERRLSAFTGDNDNCRAAWLAGNIAEYERLRTLLRGQARHIADTWTRTRVDIEYRVVEESDPRRFVEERGNWGISKRERIKHLQYPRLPAVSKRNDAPAAPHKHVSVS